MRTPAPPWTVSPHSTSTNRDARYVNRLRVPAAALAALALAFAAGCAAGGDTATAGTPGPSAPAAAPVTVTDPWVKAGATGMTAAFGVLVNNTDHEITVVSGTSPAAKTVELHEVAMAGGAMVMRPKAGGFVIEARGSHPLKPGGDHIMLMAVTAAVKPGDHVPVTLRLADGGTVAFTAVAKDFAGGREDYQPGGGASPGDGMSPGAGMNAGGGMNAGTGTGGHG